MSLAEKCSKHLAGIEAALQERLSLAEQLRATANALESTGTPPSSSVIASLKEFRSHFLRCVDAYRTISPAKNGNSIAPKNLEELKGAIEELLRENSCDPEAVEKVAQVSSKVYRFQARDPDVADELLKVREGIDQVRADIAEMDLDTEAALERLAPYDDLVQLVSLKHMLSITEQVKLDDCVRKHFGKLIGVAVNAGLINLAKENDLPNAENKVPQVEPVGTPDVTSKESEPAKAGKLDDEAFKDNQKPAEASETLSSTTVDNAADGEPCAPDEITSKSSEKEETILDSPTGPECVYGPSPQIEISAPDPATVEDVKKSDDSNDDSLPVDGNEENDEGLASTIRSSSADVGIVVSMLRSGRFSIAYHLANVMDRRDPGFLIPPDIVSAIALAPLVRKSYGPFSELVQRGLSKLFLANADTAAHHTAQERLAMELLSFAAALRPALVAAGNGADEVIRAIEPSIEPIAELRKSVLEWTEGNFQHMPSLLQGGREKEKWKKQLEEISEESSVFLLRERISKATEYQPAVHLWHHVLGKDQPLGRALTIVCDNDTKNRNLVKKEFERWSDTGRLEKEIEKVRGGMRRSGPRSKHLEGRALNTLKNRFGQAATILGEWLDTLSKKPDQLEDYRLMESTRIRKEMKANLRIVAECLGDFSGEGIANGAAACLLRTVEDVRKLVDGKTSLSPRSVDTRHILSLEILRLPNLALDENWMPAAPDSAKLLNALRALASRDGTWDSDLRQLWENADFESTNRVFSVILEIRELEGLVKLPDFDSDIDNLESENARRLSEQRELFRHDHQQTCAVIDSARTKGYIDEDARLGLVNRIDSMDPDRVLRFLMPREELLGIENEVCLGREQKLKTAWSDFEELHSHGVSQDNIDRVNELLTAEDIITAREYVALLKQGEMLPDAESDQEGIPFLPDFLEKLGNQELHPNQISNSRSLKIPGFHIDLPPREIERVTKVSEIWCRMRKGKKADVSSLRNLFDFIGFSSPGLQQQKSKGRASVERFLLRVKPLQSRRDCAIPDFGSEADGVYEIVCLFGKPLEQNIIKSTETANRTAVFVVLYFGVMNARRRRDLAHELRRSPERKILVLDDALLLYLFACKNPLRRFFECAGMFTNAKPFRSASGTVPIEMFFGRRREITSVFERSGTNLVYGGRQLGKTALLREVVRREHNEEAGVLVIYVDLTREENIGHGRPSNEIWDVIASRLANFRITSRNTRRAETLSEDINRWLGDKPNRRILFLLDEADSFLNQESKLDIPWKNLGQLSVIMTKTDRRFKVVFSGLHNVQRTSRDVNSPLAHLGEPICVGPFVEDDIRQATEMVLAPFRAMGYDFQPSDLVGRILAHTNYYPSLIHLFCEQLLSHLIDPLRTHHDKRSSPPYLITSRDVEGAYSSNQLRKQIADKFRRTLDLDSRYRVLVLVIALRVSEEPEDSGAGLSLEWIRDEALDWWHQGFVEGASIDAFRTLLEEMIGLGLLRETSPSWYNLRSPNIVSLLSTEGDLLRQLESALKHEGPIEYDSISYRRRYGNSEHRWLQAPLTADQEHHLLDSDNGVVTIFGSKASGIEHMKPYLESLGRSRDNSKLVLEWYDEILDVHQFDERLDKLRRGHKDGLILMVVSPSCPWCEKWIQQATLSLARRKNATRSFVRVLFLGNGAAAWRWIRSATPEELNVQATTRVISLVPWKQAAVQSWKQEASIGEPTAEDYKLFNAATGNWTHFLCDLGEKICSGRPDTWRDCVRTYQDELMNSSETLDCFEIPEQALAVYRVLSGFMEPLSESEAIELADQDFDKVAVSDVFRWGDLTQVLQPAGERRWLLAPIVAKLMRQVAD